MEGFNDISAVGFTKHIGACKGWVSINHKHTGIWYVLPIKIIIMKITGKLVISILPNDYKHLPLYGTGIVPLKLNKSFFSPLENTKE